MSGKVIEIVYEPQPYQRAIHDCQSRYRVLNIGRRGGKTELIIQEMIMRALQDPGLYWITAPSYRQVKSIVWTRLKQVLSVDLESWRFNEQELYAEHIDCKTRIELRGTDNEDSLRGVGLKGVAMDEAAMTKANVWPEIIRPMLADSRGWALFVSTPKGRNWFYDLYIKGLEDGDFKSWHYPTTVNTYIHPDEVETAKKDLPEVTFRQEFLAEFLDDETGVFKKVNQCIVGEPKGPEKGRFYSTGIDLAKTQDFTVIATVDSVTRELVDLDRFKDILWAEQKLRIQHRSHLYNNSLCLIDSTGVGDPVLEDLQLSGVSAEGYKFNNTSKKNLIDNLSIAIERRLITIPREYSVLIDELKSFEYKVTPMGNITYGAADGKHDDCVIALALAVWNIRNQLKEAQVVSDDILDSDQDRQGRGIKVTEDEDEPIY